MSWPHLFYNKSVVTNQDTNDVPLLEDDGCGGPKEAKTWEEDF